MKRPLLITLLSVALLLVAAAISATVYFAARNGIDSFLVAPQDSATMDESKTFKVDSKKTVNLSIIDDAGSVTVIGADVKDMDVTATITAYAKSESDAQEKLKTVKYKITQNGNNISINYEIPSGSTLGNNTSTVDFVITVPYDTKMGLDGNIGNVEVSNIKGGAEIKNDFGDVTLENIESAVSVTSNGGKVTLTSVDASENDIYVKSDFGQMTLSDVSGGNITITSNGGSITLTEVNASGDLITKTDFGDTEFQSGSADTVSMETNGGKVTLENIKTAKELIVDDDFGKITLTKAFAGSYDLHTNGGSISVDGAKNNLKAYTDFGNISIVNAQSVTLDLKTNGGKIEFSGSLGDGPHNVKSDFGDVTLSIPADSELNADFKTDFGKINSEIPITVNFDSNSDKNHPVGTMNGGGDLLTITTNGGGITITILDK